jgi:hypothetical protein
MESVKSTDKKITDEAIEKASVFAQQNAETVSEGSGPLRSL